jgi:F-type H+-transporting ATPase subunit alpha
MKQVSGSMKLDLAQYREMASFAQFASDLDSATKNLLDRGAHLTELLKQPVYNPMPVEDEVVSIFAGVHGFLDKLPLQAVKAFEADSLTALKTEHPEYLEEIRTKKALSPELQENLKAFYASRLERYKENEKAA